METLPKITVITPSFNQGGYIEETIRSILDQAYPNLEYFIIDGGSTDNTVDVIKKYQDKITWWISEKDRGQTDALNKGFRKSTGSILCWINSDDVLAPGCLQHVASLFQASKCNLVSGPIEIFDNQKRWRCAPAYQPGESLQVAIGKDFYNQPGTFFNREALHRVGLLDERLHYVMDKEWWIRYLLYCGVESITVTDRILAYHRYHDTSKTIAQVDKFMTEYAQIIYAHCMQAHQVKLAQVLSLKYHVQSAAYSCNHSMENWHDAYGIQLVANLLVRRVCLPLSPKDYELARALVTVVPDEIYIADAGCAVKWQCLRDLGHSSSYMMYRWKAPLRALINCFKR